jgi:hypothetical protein
MLSKKIPMTFGSIRASTNKPLRKGLKKPTTTGRPNKIRVTATLAGIISTATAA